MKTTRNEMREAIVILYENYDFENPNDFYKAMTEDIEALIDFLKWRSSGGTFKNEGITQSYIEACSFLLQKIA